MSPALHEGLGRLTELPATRIAAGAHSHKNVDLTSPRLEKDSAVLWPTGADQTLRYVQPSLRNSSAAKRKASKAIGWR